MGKEKKFEAACHLIVRGFDFNEEEKERLALDLKACGYDIGDCFVNDVDNPYSYLHIFTNTDGSVRRDDNGEYNIEIPDDTIDCGMDAYLFISIAKIKTNETLNCFFTNGVRWWLNKDDKPHFLAAAQRMGFHKATPAEVLQVFNNIRKYKPKYVDPFTQLTDMNYRMQGNTTRLVDDFVQELFKNAGDWITVHDHHPKGTKWLIERLVQRMNNEHHIKLDVDICNNKLRINPNDINFLK